MKNAMRMIPVLVVLLAGGMAWAQTPAEAPEDDQAVTANERLDETITLSGKPLAAFAACLGAGVIIIGGAIGIGKIGAGAVEAIARQPEAAAQMFLAWLLPAAMIEGAMLFGVVVCLMAIL